MNKQNSYILYSTTQKYTFLKYKTGNYQVLDMKKKFIEEWLGNQSEGFEEWLELDEDVGTHRDWVALVLPDLNYQAHLIAIKGLLAVHKNISNNNAEEIKEIFNEEKWYSSIYEDAAHSMAAVGMLAPFIESIFYQSFFGIKKELFSENKGHNRHQRWEESTVDTWDCHFVWRQNHREKNLVEGILQLSDATGLKNFLPDDLAVLLKVLFAYRNKMFHFGFEWPTKERKKFWQRIQNENWPSNWITAAKHGGEPWIIYLSDDFITHCVERTEEILDGISYFVFKMYGFEEDSE